MESLMSKIKTVINNSDHNLPFSVYSSIKAQRILNVPVLKPLLVLVLSGEKQLGVDKSVNCGAGNFIFLPSGPSVQVRNIPYNDEYFALLIEFDEQDLQYLNTTPLTKHAYCQGEITDVLQQCLMQFVESAAWAPAQVYSLRKQEIIELLCHMGYREILSMMAPRQLSYRLHELFSQQCHKLDLQGALTLTEICQKLAMSESTMRRKLKLEGISVQEIKDQTRLGIGLHLLQTTEYSIGLVAEKCGYLSQSRFTDRFKGRFGLTPSELRKTRMAD